MSKKISIERRRNDLYIRYRWRGLGTIILLAFGGIMTLVGLLLGFSGESFVLLFPLLGIPLIYLGIASLLNYSEITVGGRQLALRHGPLPSLRRDQTVEAREVTQLYLTRIGEQTVNGKTTPLFNLRAKLRDESSITLLAGLKRELAEEAERAVEDYLGIEDEQVSESPFDLAELIDEKKLPAFVRRGIQSLETQAQEQRAAPTVPKVDQIAEPAYDEDTVIAYRATPGSRVRIDGKTYTVRRNDRLDIGLTDGEGAAHEFELGGPDHTRHFYAESNHGRWRYFEERPLTSDEMVGLGFTDSRDRPSSLRNGEDRYYPGEALPTGDWEQYVYFASTDSAQFRVLRRRGGADWRVFVQEPFDDGYFERVD